MNEQDPIGIKEAQAAIKDAVEFQKDIASTLHKSYLQATQAIVAGYSEALQQTYDRCGYGRPVAKKK